MTIPNRIVLIARGRHDEAVASADCWPGMLLVQGSTGQVAPHNILGQNTPLIVATEEALRGLDITQKLPSGDQTSFHRSARGDEILMLLQNGQNVTNGAGLMSAGDGTLIAATGAGLSGSTLYQITAPSATITNTTTDTAFSNGSYTFPANFFQVGDVVRVRSKAFCIAVTAAATQQVRTYLGAGPTTLADATALSLVAADIVLTELTLTIRTIGASGTFVGDGVITSSVAGSFTVTPLTIASTAIDTTVTQLLTVKAKASAAAAGNQIRLDEFAVSIGRGGFGSPLVFAYESVNNSGGSGTSGFNNAAFIRTMAP